MFVSVVTYVLAKSKDLMLVIWMFSMIIIYILTPLVNDPS